MIAGFGSFRAMTGSSSWVSLLFMVALIDSGFAEEQKYLFHIPWACSVMYKDGELIGAGAIIETAKVLVSVDNFNETVFSCTDPPKRYYEVIDEVYVHAGTNFMNPTRLVRKSRYAQTRKAVKLYVAFKSPTSFGNGQWDIKMNPTDISQAAGAEYDARGLAFSVGILELSKPFARSAYVLPMLIKGPNLQERTNAFKRKLETTEARTRTCVTYSWNQQLNKIRYHEVTYQPETNCIEVFCNWDLNNCRQFPRKDYLQCFKSVQYVDVCPNARGAALYCPSFNNSVFAILTTAPSCGRRHMPGVYTTLPMVVDFFEKAYKVDFQLERRTSYDLFDLPQLNSDYPGVP